MFEQQHDSIAERFRKRGPSWRVSTWWQSDTRDSMQHSLLRVLSVAHQQRLDTGTLVDNLADEHAYSYRRRLRRLAQRLSSGTPLVSALEQTPDLLDDETVLAIRFANQTGTLDATFQHLIDRRNVAAARGRGRLRQLSAFYGATILFTIGVISFLFVFIVPVFMEMLHEFEIAPPRAFSSLVGVAEHLGDYATYWILAIFGLAWLMWSGRSRRFFRRVIATNWYPPVAQLRSAELLNLLSFAVENGRPLPGAISTLARYHFDKNVRQKLLLTRNEIEQGAELWRSLSDTQLLTEQESQALAKCSSNRSRVWTMRKLADWKRNQVIRHHENAISLLQPALVLLIAGIVLFLGIAFFQFLAQMIDVLS